MKRKMKKRMRRIAKGRKKLVGKGKKMVRKAMKDPITREYVEGQKQLAKSAARKALTRLRKKLD